MSITAHEIQNLLQSKFPTATISVRGDDGVHFAVNIACDSFKGISRVMRHKMVYAALGSNMDELIHALSIKAMDLDEV